MTVIRTRTWKNTHYVATVDLAEIFAGVAAHADNAGVPEVGEMMRRLALYVMELENDAVSAE